MRLLTRKSSEDYLQQAQLLLNKLTENNVEEIEQQQIDLYSELIKHKREIPNYKSIINVLMDINNKVMEYKKSKQQHIVEDFINSEYFLSQLQCVWENNLDRIIALNTNSIYEKQQLYYSESELKDKLLNKDNIINVINNDAQNICINYFNNKQLSRNTVLQIAQPLLMEKSIALYNQYKNTMQEFYNDLMHTASNCLGIDREQDSFENIKNAKVGSFVSLGMNLHDNRQGVFVLCNDRLKIANAGHHIQICLELSKELHLTEEEANMLFKVEDNDSDKMDKLLDLQYQKEQEDNYNQSDLRCAMGYIQIDYEDNPIAVIDANRMRDYSPQQVAQKFEGVRFNGKKIIAIGITNESDTAFMKVASKRLVKRIRH